MLLILAHEDKMYCQCGPRDKKSCPSLLYTARQKIEEFYIPLFYHFYDLLILFTVILVISAYCNFNSSSK